MTKVMSHIIGVRKKADSQKGVRKAKSLGTSALVNFYAWFCGKNFTSHKTFTAFVIVPTSVCQLTKTISPLISAINSATEQTNLL